MGNALLVHNSMHRQWDVRQSTIDAMCETVPRTFAKTTRFGSLVELMELTRTGTQHVLHMFTNPKKNNRRARNHPQWTKTFTNNGRCVVGSWHGHIAVVFVQPPRSGFGATKASIQVFKSKDNMGEFKQLSTVKFMCCKDCLSESSWIAPSSSIKNNSTHFFVLLCARHFVKVPIDCTSGVQMSTVAGQILTISQPQTNHDKSGNIHGIFIAVIITIDPAESISSWVSLPLHLWLSQENTVKSATTTTQEIEKEEHATCFTRSFMRSARVCEPSQIEKVKHATDFTRSFMRSARVCEPSPTEPQSPLITKFTSPRTYPLPSSWFVPQACVAVAKSCLRCCHRRGRMWGPLVSVWTGVTDTVKHVQGLKSNAKARRSSPLASRNKQEADNLLCELLSQGPTSFTKTATLSQWLVLQDGVVKAATSPLALLCSQSIRAAPHADLDVAVRECLSSTPWVRDMMFSKMARDESWGRTVVQHAIKQRRTVTECASINRRFAEELLCENKVVGKGQGQGQGKGAQTTATVNLLHFQKLWLTTLLVHSIAASREANQCCCAKHFTVWHHTVGLANVDGKMQSFAHAWLKSDQLMFPDTHPSWMLATSTFLPQLFELSQRLQLVSLNIACHHLLQIHGSKDPILVVEMWMVARRSKGLVWNTCLALIRKHNIRLPDTHRELAEVLLHDLEAVPRL